MLFGTSGTSNNNRSPCYKRRSKGIVIKHLNPRPDPVPPIIKLLKKHKEGYYNIISLPTNMRCTLPGISLMHASAIPFNKQQFFCYLFLIVSFKSAMRSSSLFISRLILFLWSICQYLALLKIANCIQQIKIAACISWN